MPLDANDERIRQVFKHISRNQRLDNEKLVTHMRKTFDDQTELVYPLVKKSLGGLKSETEVRHYVQAVQKFISMDLKQIKECYFTILDLNNDRRICETDLFRILTKIESLEMQEAMSDDIVILLLDLQKQRTIQNKDNEIDMFKQKVQVSAEQALLKKSTQTDPKHLIEIGQFLAEVKRH